MFKSKRQKDSFYDVDLYFETHLSGENLELLWNERT